MKGQEVINHIVRARMPDREQVRADCVRQAARQTQPKRKTWIMQAAPVAAAALVLAAVFVLGRGVLFDRQAVPDSDIAPAQAVANMPSAPDVPGNASSPETEHAIYIPALELPQGSGDGAVRYDMIGLFVYQGRIYTSAASYHGEDAQAVLPLVGDKVGYATGNISEWSSQEEYAIEFAGSVAGDVFTVNGCDPRFRLCMVNSYTDENGNELKWVTFYEWLNGYGITKGCDLFAFKNLLEIEGGEVVADKWKYIKYQEHDNWNNGFPDYVYRDLEGVSEQDITAFFHELYFGKFEYVYESMGRDFYFDRDTNEKQRHLYVHMDDATVVELRLFEGGYVGYQHLGWYFVKMPGEAFDTIFNACQ